MRKQSSHGTVDQMISAFESKLAELGGNNVTSATDVVSDDVEYTNVRSGKTYTTSMLRDLFRLKEKNGYPGSFEDWVQDMLDDGNLVYASSITSSTGTDDYLSVNIDSGDEEITYRDSGGGFGAVDDILSLADIKTYWNNNHEDDPSLSQYDSFESWFADTRQWLSSDVDASTDISSSYGLNPALQKVFNRVITLEGEAPKYNDKDHWEQVVLELTDTTSYTQEDVDDIVNALITHYSSAEACNSTDGLLPIDSAEDLNNVYMIMSYDAAGPETGMDGDSLDFICKLRAKDLDDAIAQVADYNNVNMTNYYAEYYIPELDDGSEVLDSLDELYSLSDVDAASDIDDDFEYRERYIHTLMGDIEAEGQSEVDSFTFHTTDSSLIVTVSYLGEVREYTVPMDDLTFDFNRLSEDVSYILNTIYQDLDTMGEDESGEFTEIASKTVPDSDGFTTDYTMYRNNTTGEYVFVFGDKDIYTPESGDFDWSCDSEEEAWDWYNNYEGVE